jgi:hypothetical protein
MSEAGDEELFRRLDQGIQWDTADIVETEDVYLLTIDADCQRLVGVFDEHCIAYGVAACTNAEKTEILGSIAQMIEREFENLNDLIIDGMLQTRGDGLCMTFTERGTPDDIQFLTGETRIRGRLLGVHCLPIPSEYALIAGVTDDESEYLPTLCLVLAGTNLEEFDVNTHDELVAIPLRSGGIGFDQVVERGA